ncbi:NAD(P)-dependent alcohol dehydrogenase [Sphingomonas sp. CCH5-D11]|uniref:NAD(P)-dependent alcohol dehydrogenase n=1 Tax=Sphingomonas sp. CCH5-D11 TaxID=1768786 RepID=UPI0009E95D7D|nr:NAD(P)-dependent alcohol dehydrogenase [Sphingomonas sp. CCH5-D11]
MCTRCDNPAHLPTDESATGHTRRAVVAGSAALASTALLPSTASAQANGIPAVGYAVDALNAPLKPFSFTRRNLRADDILIDIQFAGICHSDIHTVNGDWGALAYKMVPGHEILGRVAAVGSSVSRFKVGDYAGVGCLVDSCGRCEYCRKGMEPYCEQGATFTYNSKDRYGANTQGGYANRIVVKDSFAIRISERANMAATTPLLCAGITTFSPMEHWKVEKGQKVGLVGMGGLGHVAVKLFKDRGADVTVFTTSPGKVADARRFGASEAVLWSDKAAFGRMKRQFDYILSTVPQPFDVNPFLELLTIDGTMTTVGVFAPLTPGVNGANLVQGRRALTGSWIGGIAETQAVIDHCVERGITADVEIIPITRVNEAYKRVVSKDVRYRYVIDMSTLRA